MPVLQFNSDYEYFASDPDFNSDFNYSNLEQPEQFVNVDNQRFRFQFDGKSELVGNALQLFGDSDDKQRIIRARAFRNTDRNFDVYYGDIRDENIDPDIIHLSELHYWNDLREQWYKYPSDSDAYRAWGDSYLPYLRLLDDQSLRDFPEHSLNGSRVIRKYRDNIWISFVLYKSVWYAVGIKSVPRKYRGELGEKLPNSDGTVTLGGRRPAPSPQPPWSNEWRDDGYIWFKYGNEPSVKLHRTWIPHSDGSPASWNGQFLFVPFGFRVHPDNTLEWRPEEMNDKSLLVWEPVTKVTAKPKKGWISSLEKLPVGTDISKGDLTYTVDIEAIGPEQLYTVQVRHLEHVLATTSSRLIRKSKISITVPERILTGIERDELTVYVICGKQTFVLPVASPGKTVAPISSPAPMFNTVLPNQLLPSGSTPGDPRHYSIGTELIMHSDTPVPTRIFTCLTCKSMFTRVPTTAEHSHKRWVTI